MWHIGQRVVCVDDKGVQPIVKPLIKGRIYTIREITNYSTGGFRLHEIHNEPCSTTHGFLEVSYKARRFRPIDEKRIDIFRAMLKNKEKEKVK